MPIVGGLDIHRAQITVDYLDLRTGEETRGTIRPATREEFRRWLTRARRGPKHRAKTDRADARLLRDLLR